MIKTYTAQAASWSCAPEVRTVAPSGGGFAGKKSVQLPITVNDNMPGSRGWGPPD